MTKVFDGVIKSAIKSVYDDINEGTENFRKSFDLLQRVRRRHFNRLESSLASIQIWCMSGPARLSDIYIPTKLSERVSRNYFIDLDLNKSLNDIKTLALEEEISPRDLIKSSDSIMILGGPGAGKTTFLTSLVLGQAGIGVKQNEYLNEPLFPIWVSLRSVTANPSSIKKFVLDSVVVDEEEAEDSWPFLKRLLTTGKIMLVLDGLDEISYDKQVWWRDFLNKFKKTYGQCKVIASCRVGALQVDFPGFKHAEVMPFGKKDKENFIENWFGSERKDLSNKLKEDISTADGVNELSNSPLLLSLLCILFESDLDLPTHRTDLFSRCVEAMLNKWDSSRGFKRENKFPELSMAKRRRIFQKVAIEFSAKHKSVLKDTHVNSIVGKYIEKYDMDSIQSDGVLSELESHHGLLIKPAANAYSFSHMSIQDFFSAEFIVTTRQEMKYVNSQASNIQKRDIIVFCSCLVEDAGEMATALIQKSYLKGRQNYPSITSRLSVASVLVRVLASGAAMAPSIRKKIVPHLIETFEYAVSHFQKTGLNLYCSFINSEIKVRCTFFSKRSTYNEVILALEDLLEEFTKSNSSILLEEIKTFLIGDVNYSCRALLSAPFFKKNTDYTLSNYKRIAESDNIPSVYISKVKEVIKLIE